MPMLHEIQRQFSHDLFEHNISQPQRYIQSGSINVKTGIEIYRNNVFTNLREALRTLFPVINKLVGEEFFNFATEYFIRDYPSLTGDLNQYGEKFSDFLSEFDAAAGLVYLPDVARLEWAVHVVYHAQVSARFDIQQLAFIPSSAYGELRFKLNPACVLLHSNYPVHTIWQVNQTNYVGDTHVDISNGGVSLLISRCDSNIELQVLAEGEWAFLSAIAKHEPFFQACSQGLKLDSTFNLKAAMTRFVQQSVIVDFNKNK